MYLNNFGLGLILNFTDNATSGIQNATRSFQDLRTATADFSQANGVDSALMSISASCGIVGSELVRVGESITSTFANATKSIIDTGTTISMAKKQLSTLYGSEVLGAQKLEQVKDYAEKSIFNFKDLIPSVIMLKANGIEAFDQIASSAYTASNGTEGARQTLMDYAADLAAFNPRMKNTYGTGVQAAMGALNEYIAEGNAMSLKRGASLDINSLLGEKTAGTIEERSVQVADLLDKLGMVGMTASMANTPMQRLSNVSDLFFNLVTEIANSGVMEKYTELIAKFTDYLFHIPDDEMKNMAKVIGGAITELMSPLSHIIDLGIKVVDWLRETVKTNPELIKTILKVTALVGVFTLLSGIALKLASSLGFLRIALFGLTGAGSATGGIKLLGLLKNLAIFVLPVIAAIILLKLAWDKNFMGMRDTATNVFKNIWDTFRIVVEAFKNNTLSEESFLRAKDLGILPLIESILQLKYHWGFFVKGFKKGVDEFFTSLGEVLTRTGILKADVSGLGGVVKALIDKMTAPGMTETWENVGKFLGESAGWIILIIALLPVVLKLVSLIVGITKILLGTIKAIWTVLKFIGATLRLLQSVGRILLALSGINFAAIGASLASIGTAIAGFFSAIGTALLGVLGAIAAFVGLPVWLVALIAVAIVALVALVIIFWDEIKAFFINVGKAIADFFVNVFNKVLQNPIVQVIIGIFSTIVSVVKSFISNAVQVVVGFAQMIWTIAKGIFGIVKSIVMGIVNIIKAIVGVIVNIVYAIYEVIRVIVLAIILVVQKIWEAIKTGLDFVFGIFSTVFGAVYDTVIAPIVDKISVIWGWLCNNVFAPVGEFISGIFDNIMGKVQVVGEFFKTIFGGVRDFLCSAFQKVSDFVSPILKGISDAITWIADSITKVISGVGEFFGGIGEFFGGIGDNLQEAVGLSTGGYVKTTGIAMLHPDEVVVNDALTQRLGAFLGDYNNAKFTNSPLVTQNIVATDDYKEDKNTPVNVVNPTPQAVGNDIATQDTSPNPLRELANTQVNNHTTNHMKSEEDNSSADNSVVFESGSIVVQAVGQNGKISDEELYAMSDRLMQIMGRKMQLRNLQTRK